MRSIIVVLTLVGMIGCLCACMAQETPAGVQLHGYMQNRIYSAPGSNLQFRNERISISALAGLPNDSNAYVELYYHPWASASGLYLESAYYDTGLGNGRLRVGKGRRLTFGITPSWPNRKTSNYGLVSETFTQDRIQGIQYYSTSGNFEGGLAVHTAYRLGTRVLGEVPGDSRPEHEVKHLAFRDLPGSWSRKLEVSGRLGGKWQNLSGGVSGSFASLDSRDMDFLETEGLIAPGATSNDRRVIGVDARYKAPSGFIAQGEWYDASASTLDYDAWNVVAGLEQPSGWKYFARYSKKNMGIAPTANPLSWDTSQISLSMVQPLRKGLWIQYEYEINRESPPAGTDSRSNNLFFVELFTGF